MDPFEPLDNTIAEMNDPVYTAAVAEANSCYDELAQSVGNSQPIFDRLKKAAAIVQGKLAELEVKRQLESELDKVAYKKKLEKERDAKAAVFEQQIQQMQTNARDGDPVAKTMVEAQKEIESATGKKAEELFKSLFF